MIEFTLKVFVPNKDGDRMYVQRMEWPVLPRAEEEMLLTGNVDDTVIIIEGTEHDLSADKKDALITVYGRLSRKRDEDIDLLVRRGFVLSR